MKRVKLNRKKKKHDPVFPAEVISRKNKEREFYHFKAIGQDNEMGTVNLTWEDGTRIQLRAEAKGMQVRVLHGSEGIFVGRLAMIQTGACNVAEIITVE